MCVGPTHDLGFTPSLLLAARFFLFLASNTAFNTTCPPSFPLPHGRCCNVALSPQRRAPIAFVHFPRLTRISHTSLLCFDSSPPPPKHTHTKFIAHFSALLRFAPSSILHPK